MKKRHIVLSFITVLLSVGGIMLAGNETVGADDGDVHRYELNTGKTPADAGCTYVSSKYNCPTVGGGETSVTTKHIDGGRVVVITSASELSLYPAAVNNYTAPSGSTLNTTCPQTSFFNVCIPGGSAEGVIPQLILTILNWALIGVGTVVVVFIVIGGIMYMTAAGNQERAKGGVKIIQNAILGLVLYLIMITALNFLIPGGVFNGT